MTRLSIIALSTLLVACGGGGDKKSDAKVAKAEAKKPDAKKAEAKKADEKKAEAKKPAKKEIKDGELPWSFDDVRNGLEIGTAAVYDRNGTDKKGKKVGGQFRWVLKKNADDGAGVVGVPVEGKAAPGSDQLATVPWSRMSPFFAVERAESKVTGREKIKVPAGEFDCIKAEVKGFFGAEQHVWMIVDKPGVYARVVDKGNAQEEKDKTELTYELASVEVLK